MPRSIVEEKESDDKSDIKARYDRRHKDQESKQLSGMRKGGKVRATGRRRLHRGEIVRRSR